MIEVPEGLAGGDRCLSRLCTVPLTRRSLLTALGMTVVAAPAGCTLFNGEPAAPRASASPPPPDPLLPLVSAESAVLALYDGVMGRHPQLAGRLRQVRDDHAAHVEALRAVVRPPAPSPSVPATPSAVVAPATVPAALAALRAAESAAAKRSSVACLTATAGRAPLLGSIAACESAHLVLLQ